MRTSSWIAALGLILLPLAESGQGPAAQPAGAPVLAFKSGAVGTIGTGDWELTLRIRQMLAKDADLATLNPGVHVKSGIASLSGPVPSAYFRRRAEERVLTVPGVRQVHNELAVRSSPAQEPGLARQSSPIDQPGPPLPLQKLIGPAQPRSKPAPPVARLASRVEVDPDKPEAQARLSSEARVSSGDVRERERMDADVLFAVERILRNNPPFAAVSATVSAGQVLLAGSVRTLGERDDLITALRALEGVRTVQVDRVLVDSLTPHCD